MKKYHYLCNDMRKIFIMLVLALLPFGVAGQTERNDNVTISDHRQAIDKQTDSTNISINFNRRFLEHNQYYLHSNVVADSSAFKLPKINLNIPSGESHISSWHGGRLYATGGVQTMPGLMAVNSGSLAIEQKFGNLTVNISALATKYGFFNGLQTSYGFGGNLTYKFSDKISATLFGEYHSSVRIGNPAMAGYVNIPRFGSYIDYSLNERFGVDIGVQGYRSSLTRRVEMQPIVRPYFRVSKNNKIGIDVGGILYQMMKSHTSSYRQPHNPTIGPPVQKLSQTMGY